MADERQGKVALRPATGPRPLPPLDELSRRYRVEGGVLVRRTAHKDRKAGDPAGHIKPPGYWYVKVGKHGSFPCHRIIWALSNGRDPYPLLIDHIDGNPSNNDPANLRAVTLPQNNRNKSPGKGWHRVQRGFQARLSGKHIGFFKTADEARDAYLAARAKEFGEYADAA